MTYIVIITIGYFSTYELTPEIFLNRKGESMFMVIAKLFYCMIVICDIALGYYMSKSGIEWTVGLRDRNFTFWENLLSASIILPILAALSYKTSVITLMTFLGGTANIYFVFFIPSNYILNN